ncbi:alpha/beta fold hydrolase [Kineococcus sp. SYSU DK018]|uniref:alpha/beta fold hydrolase n=1 Tax=Kineococcus sp. SYSU DK018 TaxID=3383139 RepID=UPI003D7E8BC7
MQRLQLRREDVTLSYLDSGGPGPVVVLLHGLAGSAGELAATAAALSDGYRVLALDQRGHGHSTRRPADTSRRAYVEDVVALIAAATGGAPVSVVGQSMGAHTALLLAAWHPHLVQHLVLLEGGVGGGAQDTSAQLGSWFACWPVPFPSRQAAVEHLGATPTAAAWAQDLQERDGGFWPRFDADVMQAAIAAVAQSARWTEWQQVQAPTLLVQAERSYLDAAEIAQMLELRPGTGHVVVPDAGHDVHLDQPQAWTQLLRRYLDTAHAPSGDWLSNARSST